MTYALFIILFVGAVLFHGYQKGRRSLKRNNESHKEEETDGDNELTNQFRTWFPDVDKDESEEKKS